MRLSKEQIREYISLDLNNAKFYGGKRVGSMIDFVIETCCKVEARWKYKPHRIRTSVQAENLVMMYSGALHNPYIYNRKQRIKEILDAMDLKGRELSEESIK